MKLVYISPLRYPSEKAGSAFSMRSCEAFSSIGYEVELWVPRRLNSIDRDPFDYHQVQRIFRIVRLPALDLSAFTGRFFLILSISFGISVLVYAMWRRLLYSAIFYSHEEFGLFLLTFVFPKTVYEMHDFPGSHALYRVLIKRIWKIVSTNSWKRDELKKRFSISESKIFVIPNAVDVTLFSEAPGRFEARQRLGLSDDKKIIVYTGHLYSWKGVDTFLESAQAFPEHLFYLVGGTERDLSVYRDRYRGFANIVFPGMRPHEEVPFWLHAADILVLPNTAKEDISKYYTSPMKLFEYMASNTPIIASDLPSVREIVTDREALFFEADRAASLSEKIAYALSHPEEAGANAKRAFECVTSYTWPKRALKIKRFLSG